MSDPRPDFLEALPELVAERFKMAFPQLRQCEGMAGRFNLERLKTVSVKAPAVLVSMVGMRQADTWAGPHYGFVLDMAAFVITKDTPQLSRDAAGANIAQALAGLIPDKIWGQSQCGPAKTVSADPIVTQGFQSAKVSLWAVTWKQPCVLKGIPDQQVIPVDLYYSQAPDIGAGNEGSYTQTNGGQP